MENASKTVNRERKTSHYALSASIIRVMADEQRVRKFQEEVREYYTVHGRHDLPWRQSEPDGTFDPYKILVSELMLQQTQVSRVVPKYREFLVRFPRVEVLAAASQGEVLKAWQGLGYNRRAKFLWQAAGMVRKEYDGELPRAETQLVKLPGIGKNTAAAIVAYAYNQKALFIETNIRTVFIHHFFANSTEVTDGEILPLVALALPDDSPREWYWALMDYGVFLKKTVGNLNKLSKSYTKQTTFHGSKRQLRGTILRMLSEGPLSRADLVSMLADNRTPEVLADLEREELIHTAADTDKYRL